MLPDFFLPEGSPRCILASWITDLGGEISEEHDDFVPQTLHIAQEPKPNGMPKVELGTGRVNPEIKTESSPAPNCAEEFLL
jgi:hypothetical protein